MIERWPREGYPSKCGTNSIRARRFNPFGKSWIEDMARLLIGGLLSFLLICPHLASAARPVTGVISQETAQRAGLERAWAARVELNGGRGRIAHISVQAGLVMVQTDQAVVQVFDAESRRTLWITQVGRPGSVTTAPAATDRFVATTNGGNLYLFERASGRGLWQKKMPTVPSAGPAFGHDRIYVPLITGMLTTFRLPARNRAETPNEQALKDSAFNYSGKGVADAPPVVTEGAVFWGTDAGNIYAVNPEQLEAQFRVQARGAVLARLTYRKPYIYAASRDGYVYAIKDLKGTIRWKSSVGNPIVEQPMVTDDGVYAITEIGGMSKLSLETGDLIWRVAGPMKFISASPTRLYTADRAGRMLIFDARTGARIGWLPTERLPLKVFNRENDRIYLSTADGLVQCLHETGLREPVWHIGPLKGGSSAKGEEPAADEMPADDATPADKGHDPFGEGDSMEDEAGAEEEQP